MTIDYALPSTKPTPPPWDASHFQVYRSGTRGYADTLPPCDFIPDPHVDPVPGFSSLKPSKPFRKSVEINGQKYTVPLDWHRAIEWIVMNGFDVDGAPSLEPFYQSANVQRDRDFARGHAIHRVAEAFLLGKPTDTETNPDAQPYLPHLIEWLDKNVTDVYALEAVVFGDGYGGTGDGWLGVRGVSAYVDFKSRGPESAHSIYSEEVAQGGAYTSARYCIVPSDDRQTAVRAPLPAATYGLVLSIRPDGVQEYWYDLTGAKLAFDLMKAAYQSTSHSGKVARASKVKDPTSTIETAKRKTKATPTVAATVAPAEGDPVADVDDIRARYVALSAPARAWVDNKRAEALAAGVDFHLAGNYTQRRLTIMDGLCVLAAAEMDDDDAVRALVRFATTDDACEWPTIPAGAAVGTMGAAEAETFASAARLLAGGLVGLELALDGARLTGVQ